MPDTLTALDDRELEQAAGGKYQGPTFVYVFQKGDKLAVLAQRYGTTVRVLQELNSLPASQPIQPGTRLLIPQR